VHLPALPVRSLETLSHTGLSLLHAAKEGMDALLVFNSANSPLVALPAAAGRKIILHTDGLEWMRDKWSGPGRRYYRLMERMAARLPIVLISDSREIVRHYRQAYGRETRYISYGAPIVESRDPSLLGRFGLEPGGYFLQIARFEPENNQLLAVRAFEKLETEKRFVLVGGARYRTKYAEEMKSTGDSRILFPGFCYEPDVLRELLCHARAYIHGNEVGGTNPGLLQAMGAGAIVIARDVPFNREVCAEAALYFRKDADDLREKMRWVLAHEEEGRAFRERARRIVRERYDWEEVASEYERLFIEVAGAHV
ncbi:MAG: glycosyltransferase family 1 protein, partial [Candidatus Aminicenantes bacterium]|nr:glycosyltransferase family 1 protein [Candidatus Aminicenantes bacterium]